MNSISLFIIRITGMQNEIIHFDPELINHKKIRT